MRNARATGSVPIQPVTLALAATLIVAVGFGAALWRGSLDASSVDGAIDSIAHSIDRQSRAEVRLASDLRELARSASTPRTPTDRSDGRSSTSGKAAPIGAWSWLGLTLLAASAAAVIVAWPYLNGRSRVLAATGMASIGTLLGSLSLMKDMNLDFTLLKDVSLHSPSVLHVSFDFDGKAAAAKPAQGNVESHTAQVVQLACDENTVGPFAIGEPASLQGDRPATSDDPDPKLVAKVDAVARSIDARLPVLLLGSTDSRQYRTREKDNPGLAVERALTVEKVLTHGPAEWPADAPAPIVLNHLDKSGVTRVIAGSRERASGRVVIICGYQPSRLPPLPQVRRPVAHTN